MIYETALVVKTDASEEAISVVKNTIAETIKEFGAEILVNDAWGIKTFAQPYENGLKKGNFFYVMYKGKGSVNAELERKFGISETVVRYLIVKLGEDRKQDEIVKAYKNPNHSNVSAQIEDDEEGMGMALSGGDDKEKKMHSKRRSCWFSAKKTSPDWKDPKSYSWLVNEFGKISAQRVTGLTPKFQRSACDAIKRGRSMGLISYLSNDIAR
jgi:ribosomal protein S18/ribosomal protein S6